MAIYKISNKQYDALRYLRNTKGVIVKQLLTHQEVLAHLNERLSQPNIQQRQVHMTHNSGAITAVPLKPIAFINKLVTV